MHSRTRRCIHGPNSAFTDTMVRSQTQRCIHRPNGAFRHTAMHSWTHSNTTRSLNGQSGCHGNGETSQTTTISDPSLLLTAVGRETEACHVTAGSADADASAPLLPCSFRWRVWERARSLSWLSTPVPTACRPDLPTDAMTSRILHLPPQRESKLV